MITESLPQAILQSYIFVRVMHSHGLDAEVFQFAAILPTSIVVSMLSLLKNWTEILYDAKRSSGGDVFKQFGKIWRMGGTMVGDLEDLKKEGYTCAEAWAAGYSCLEAKAAGYSLKEMKAAGYVEGMNMAEVKAAGFSWQEAHRAGYPASYSGAGGSSSFEWDRA